MWVHKLLHELVHLKTHKAAHDAHLYLLILTHNNVHEQFANLHELFMDLVDTFLQNTLAIIIAFYGMHTKQTNYV